MKNIFWSRRSLFFYLSQATVDTLHIALLRPHSISLFCDHTPFLDPFLRHHSTSLLFRSLTETSGWNIMKNVANETCSKRMADKKDDNFGCPPLKRTKIGQDTFSCVEDLDLHEEQDPGPSRRTVWNVCGCIIMDYMGFHEIRRTSQTVCEIWNSLYAWIMVAHGLTGENIQHRLYTLIHDFPEARQTLELWMKNSSRSSMNSQSDASVERAVQYLRRSVYGYCREHFYRPKTKHWLRRHQDIRRHYFGMLSDWLVELHFDLFKDNTRNFQCKSPLSSVHRAMKYVYIYMSRCREPVKNTRLQLVGVCCYRIAIEHEIDCADMNRMNLTYERLAHYTAGAYTKTDVMCMTGNIRIMLKRIQEHLRTLPSDACSALRLSTTTYCMAKTPAEVLNDIIETIHGAHREEKISVHARLIAHYVIDLTLYYSKFSRYVPSRIAAAALSFACAKLSDYPNASENLKHCTISRDPRRDTTAAAARGSSQHLSNRKRLLIRANISEAILEEDEKRMRTIFNAALQREVMTPRIKVVEYYQEKMNRLMHGKLTPRFKRNLFGTGSRLQCSAYTSP